MTLKQIILNFGKKKAREKGFGNTEITKVEREIIRDSKKAHVDITINNINMNESIENLFNGKLELKIFKSKL